MHVEAVRTELFQTGENLESFVCAHIPEFKDATILAIASKVVALAEGRVVEKKNVDKESLIRAESEWLLKVLPKWWLTVRDGSIVVNAGIDESNADGKLILLPEDSFASAARIRAALLERFGVKQLGVVITDSRISPLRAGVVGVALGYAGFRGVRDYRGDPDLFGRAMEVTQTDVADSLATAAALVMGEGNECQPLAVITAAPVKFCDSIDREELRMPPTQDMYKHLFALGTTTKSRKRKR